jgi:hypothetical protein
MKIFKININQSLSDVSLVGSDEILDVFKESPNINYARGIINTGMFIIIESIDIIEKFLITNGIKHEIFDVSDKFIKGEMDILDYTELVIDEEYFTFNEFKIELNNYLLSNTTVDMVLDKISEKGIESLTPFDKMILESV